MRKTVPIIWKGLCIILCITACAPNPTVSIPTATSFPSPTKTPTPTIEITPTNLSEAQLYLLDAIDIIQEYALNSKNVDWEHMREIALKSAKDAKDPADTYNTVAYILHELDDHHSYFLTPDAANQRANSTIEDYLSPDGKLLENRIGYIAVYAFGAHTEGEINQYADNIQNILIDLNKQSVCGWIVDLRENLGGNMWPMVAGLGGLIGEGELGSFKDASGHINKWFYHDGQSWEGKISRASVSHPEFLRDPDETPVAVLIGSETASSGESTAIAFRGRPNTRFFGLPTRGLTTGNGFFLLKDGAVIVLTTLVDLDRTGHEYGGKIIPDVETSNPQSDAIEWLFSQPACKK